MNFHVVTIRVIITLLFFAPLVVFAGGEEEKAEASFKDNLFVGGGLGFSFGSDLTIINVSPNVGYRVTDDFSVGVGVLYQYRNDKRFEPDLRTNDYGGSIFARYQIFDPFFAQLEFEYLNFEAPLFQASGGSFIPVTDTNGNLVTGREGFSSVFIGGGINQPVGSNVFFNIIVLYNVTYDDNEFPRPYDSPIVVRGGVTIGF